MKRKNIISLSIAFAFSILSFTGILLYIKQKPHFVEMTHTIFGLLFISFAVFHIINNLGSLKAYSKDKATGSFKKELTYVSLAGIVLLILSVTEILEPVAEFGRIFAPPRKKDAQNISFQEKTTLEGQPGSEATLLLQKKGTASFADLKVELMDSTGKSVAILYENKEEAEGPRPNILLNTKIVAASPCTLVITGTSERETLRDEYVVANLEKGIRSIANKESKLLERGYLEVK
jgi:hypothetical protein